MTFERALEVTLGFEGGFSHDPIDRGGATNYGVTQAAYDRFRKANRLRPRSVELIDQVEILALYRLNYWLTAHCDELPPRLAMCVFDSSVNHGPRTAIKLLQRALHIHDDGIFGSQTRTALFHCDEAEVIRRYLDARQDFYDDIIERDPTQIRFARGWRNRVLALQSTLLNEGMA